MPKITRLSEFQHEIPFFTFNENFDAFYAQFLKTDLGKIIGKQGRTARSLRSILNAASTNIKKRSVLEIIE